MTSPLPLLSDENHAKVKRTVLHSQPEAILESFLSECDDGLSQTIIKAIGPMHKVALWTARRGLGSYTHAILELKATSEDREMQIPKEGETFRKDPSLLGSGPTKVHTIEFISLDETVTLSAENMALIGNLKQLESTRVHINGTIVLSLAPFSQTEMETTLEVSLEPRYSMVGKLASNTNFSKVHKFVSSATLGAGLKSSVSRNFLKPMIPAVIRSSTSTKVVSKVVNGIKGKVISSGRSGKKQSSILNTDRSSFRSARSVNEGSVSLFDISHHYYLRFEDSDRIDKEMRRDFIEKAGRSPPLSSKEESVVNSLEQTAASLTNWKCLPGALSSPVVLYRTTDDKGEIWGKAQGLIHASAMQVLSEICVHNLAHRQLGHKERNGNLVLISEHNTKQVRECARSEATSWRARLSDINVRLWNSCTYGALLTPQSYLASRFARRCRFLVPADDPC